MAKKKTAPKTTPKKEEKPEPLSKKGRYGYTLKVPEGMTAEHLLKMMINVPPKNKKK